MWTDCFMTEMTSLSAEGLQRMLREVGEEQPIPVYPLASIHTNALGIFELYLAEYLTIATGCDRQVAYDSIQWPNEFGDLVAVLPRLRLSNTDTPQLAADLAAKFPPSPLFAQPFADDFNLRFMFSEQALARILLPYILDRGDLYGKEPTSSEDNTRRSVIIEYSSPNIGREFDGNHLRSTIAGAFISALYKGMGWKVCRMNFLGDWGKHIGLLSVGWSRYGSHKKLLADPLGHLLSISTRINSDLKAEKETKPCHQDTADTGRSDIGNEKDVFFKRMEDGDPEALELWQRFRDLSIVEYRELYAQMGVNFDEYSGESEVSRRAIDEVEDALREKGIYEESEQAWIIDFAKHGHPGLGTAIVRYRNGTTSYLLRDIAAVLERHNKYSFDKMIYVVSDKQTSHFKQMFRSLELMGRKDLADMLEHVSFGKVKGLSVKPDTSGLLLADILDQCQASIQNAGDWGLAGIDDFVGAEHRSWTPRRLGAATIMAHDLSGKRSSTFSFDPARHATVEGHTLLYLQSSLQRTRSVAEGKTIDRHVLSSREHSFALFEREAYVDILRHMIQFPGVVKASYKSLESAGLIAYLYRLADLLPAALADSIEGDATTQDQRTLFFQALQHVFSNGLGLLGIA